MEAQQGTGEQRRYLPGAVMDKRVQQRGMDHVASF
jgi:hypothetical protein